VGYADDVIRRLGQVDGSGFSSQPSRMWTSLCQTHGKWRHSTTWRSPTVCIAANDWWDTTCGRQGPPDPDHGAPRVSARTTRPPSRSCAQAPWTRRTGHLSSIRWTGPQRVRPQIIRLGI